jgi:hypothetical protein
MEWDDVASGKYMNPKIPQYVNVSKLMMCDAMVSLQEGNGSGSFNKSLLTLKLSNLLVQEPLLLNQMMSIAIGKISMQGIESILMNRDMSVNEYNRLISLIDIDKRKGMFVKSLQTERVYIMDTLTQFIKFNALPDYYPQKPSFMFKVFVALCKPLIKYKAIDILNTMTEQIQMIEMPYPQYKDKIDKFQAKEIPFTMGMIPAVPKYYVKLLQTNTMLDLCRVAVTLKLYKKKTGKYPDTLDKLKPKYLAELPKDRFSGLDYIYKKQGSGFMIYSIGGNLKDDKGARDENLDIVWQCNR